MADQKYPGIDWTCLKAHLDDGSALMMLAGVDLRLKTHPDDHPGYVKLDAGKYCVGDEKRAVAIAEPFWVSKYPVTNSQSAQFVQAGGYSRREFWSDEGWQWVESADVAAPAYCRNPEFNAPNQPVVGVSWWEPGRPRRLDQLRVAVGIGLDGEPLSHASVLARSMIVVASPGA